jgi:hypothetical protein
MIDAMSAHRVLSLFLERLESGAGRRVFPPIY